jgi:hypothetical protein
VDKTLTCECGYEAHAGDDDALVADVRRHAWRAHRMPLSHQEALLLVFRGELNGLPTTPRTTSTRSTEEER